MFEQSLLRIILASVVACQVVGCKTSTQKARQASSGTIANKSTSGGNEDVTISKSKNGSTDDTGGTDESGSSKGSSTGTGSGSGSGTGTGTCVTNNTTNQSGKGYSLGKPDDSTDNTDTCVVDNGPKIGIKAHLINQFPGTCRRLQMRGDGSSTETLSGVNCVGPLNFTQNNDWYSAKDFNLPTTTVKASIYKNQKNAPLPIDSTGDGIPDFPILNFSSIASSVSGTLRSSAVPVSTWHPDLAPSENIIGKVQRNLVIVGTSVQPIMINGDVLVIGDLVIKGYYSGVGTIYVTGNIFMPHDVRATVSAFPFSDSAVTAKQQGLDKSNAKIKSDSLSLVAGGYIFAGDNYPLYQDAMLNPQVQAMYAWYPGNKIGYKKLHEPVWNCQNNSFPTYTKAQYDQCDCYVQGGFNLLETNLYAANGVHGSSGSWPNAQTYIPNSFAINGVVITKRFDVVTTPDLCTGPQQLHPVHKLPQGASYLNYDWRFYDNAPGMSQLKPFYQR